jgi:hypothetical protein
VLVLAVYLSLLLGVLAERTVLIDCGSTGSRVYVYYFNPDSPLETMKELFHKRIKPGLSSFVNDDMGLRKHIYSLLKFAKNRIPYHLWSKTTISLKATAGLRELPVDQQQHLIEISSELLSSSGFLHNSNETRVLTGAEEALYGLLGIMPGLKLQFDDHVYAVADLGGSSQQFAFISSSSSSSGSAYDPTLLLDPPGTDETELLANHTSESSTEQFSCNPDFILYIPDRGSVSVMARSLSQMGLIAAMDSLDNYIMNNILSSSDNDGKDAATRVSAACTSPGSTLCTPEESAVRSCNSPVDSQAGLFFGAAHAGKTALLDGQPYYAGEGNFTQCVEDIRSVLLPQLKKLIDFRCLHSQLPSTIIGLDNYPKVLEMLKLGGDGSAVSPQQIRERGEVVCRTPWGQVLSDFPGFMPYRAQRACFGSSFIYVLLSDLYGIPDQNGVEGISKVTEFKPINNVEKQELGWAAGAAVYAALGLNHEVIVKNNFQNGRDHLDLHRWNEDPDDYADDKTDDVLADDDVTETFVNYDGSSVLSSVEALGSIETVI